METRANYVLIGAGTLSASWSPRLLRLVCATFRSTGSTITTTCSSTRSPACSRAGDVRFSGLSVGRVGVSTSPGKAARSGSASRSPTDTPIRADTVATLQSQGVTGVSFVSLASGSSRTRRRWPARRRRPGDPVAALDARQPDRDRAGAAGRGDASCCATVAASSGQENQARVTAILDNVGTASGGLETALADFSPSPGSVREASARSRAASPAGSTPSRRGGRDAGDRRHHARRRDGRLRPGGGHALAGLRHARRGPSDLRGRATAHPDRRRDLIWTSTRRSAIRRR